MSATRRTLLGRGAVVALALVTAAGPAMAQTPAATSAPAGPAAPTSERSPDGAIPQGVEAPRTRDVVGVLPLVVRGNLAEHIPPALEDRLAVGLRRGEFTVIAADEVRALAGDAPCDAACLRTAAAGAGATYLVRVEVGVEGRDYAVQVVLLRADTGEQVAIIQEMCEICGHDELAGRIDDLAAAVRRKLAAAVEPPPRLHVRAVPEGSVVTIDGDVVGVTPLEITVAAGEHDLVIQKRGFIPHRRRIAFVDGVVETIAAELAPVPTETPPDAPRKRSLAPLGWSAVAVGLGATISGVALVALDEQPIRSDCSGPNVDAEGHCKWRHDTLAGGLALTITGVAAIVVGAVVVAIDRQRSKRSQARAAAVATGLGFNINF